jgi:hypothetical protein
MPAPAIDTSQLEEAEVYMEFTRLRDHWNSLGKDNAAKRDLILDLLERAGGLIRHLDADFSRRGIAEFTRFFMEPRGDRILRNIAYPGNWRVSVLGQRFEGKPQAFREFCRFKWAFNIKPDIVILVPDAGPLCIEAKLESRKASTLPTRLNLPSLTVCSVAGRAVCSRSSCSASCSRSCSPLPAISSPSARNP